MNAQVSIMQTMDWSKFTLEEWLYQFGAWMNSVSGTCGKSINPIAIAMDSAVIKQKIAKFTDDEKKQIIAAHFATEEKPKLQRSNAVCQITDNEARAVQRLILDMQGKSHILDEWLDVVIARHFYCNSFAKIADEQHKSLMEVKFDNKAGLAAIYARNLFLKHR